MNTIYTKKMFGLVPKKFWVSPSVFSVVNRCFSGELEKKYSESQKEKILQVMNEDVTLLSRYEITKARLKNFTLWVQKHGQIKKLSDVKGIDGFTKKNAEKLFNSIINGPQEKVQNLSKKIKGQILHPHLCETLRQVSPSVFSVVNRCFSGELEKKYSESQKEKILQVMNEDVTLLSRYEITKARLKNFTLWVQKHGQIKKLSDVKGIDGFTKKNAEKLFNSIINGPQEKVQNLSKKIKGQILHPHLCETLRQSCKSVLAVYITVNSVCWTLIDKDNYEVLEWRYHGIDYPESKKMQITNILDIAWEVTNKLPTADIYVMKAEATTLRASGSDPNNPKVLGVNLQKAQLVSMIVALINAKNCYNVDGPNEETSKTLEFKQKVYFLRPTLPFRLYGTLVGNERVSTDQTVETLLQEVKDRESNSQVFVPDKLVTMFRNQKELQRDMLGQCLLLALTFMDLCIYLNKDSINKLLKRGE